jgi:hypothetical protein
MIDNGTGGDTVGDLVFPRITRKVLDNKHTFYTKDQILAVLSAMPKEAYVSDFHDCDDFAQDATFQVHQKLPGAPFGFASGKLPTGASHAVNVFFVKEPITVDGALTTGVKRYYYDATARKLMDLFDVDFMMV